MDTIEIIKLIFEVLILPVGLWGISFIWKKILKPVLKAIKDHDYIVDSIKDIRKELVNNGGSSIKDAINRIEGRQIMIDKRTKAIFYNEKEVIFEVDARGNILWANKRFHDIMGSKNIKGLDWVSYVDELHRDYFLRELESCSEKLRELKFETKSMDGKEVKFLGFPYRDNNRNFGFLIYLEGV